MTIKMTFKDQTGSVIMMIDSAVNLIQKDCGIIEGLFSRLCAGEKIETSLSVFEKFVMEVK